MPRRIALQVRGHGACSMSGIQGPLVKGFVQKPWGVNYGDWRHPQRPIGVRRRRIRAIA